MVGQYMHGVLFNYLGLDDQSIVAMTEANFTGATDPANATSVNKSQLSSIRCIWEVALGNVVSAF